MSADKATARPWYYVCGAVWTAPEGPDDNRARCVAVRASTGPCVEDLAPTEKDANMRLIVRAVNEWDEMVATLAALVEELDSYEVPQDADCDCGGQCEHTNLGKARALLAQIDKGER